MKQLYTINGEVNIEMSVVDISIYIVYQTTLYCCICSVHHLVAYNSFILIVSDYCVRYNTPTTHNDAVPNSQT